MAIGLTVLIPRLERDLGVAEIFAKELLEVMLVQWQALGFVQGGKFGLVITALGVTFAHREMILDELRRLRGNEPSLMW